jgi:hypothetical protein
MIRRLALQVGVSATLAIALCGESAYSQFGNGFVTLPRQDFTWIWGTIREGEMRRSSDLNATGSEQSFNCTLTARMSPGSHLTRTDIRNIEGGLKTSLSFIQTAAQTMYQMEQGRELNWARLECIKFEESELDAEEAQERIDKAVEKAMRERERRRNRESR